MQQATHKTLYNTHSWIGIWCGILLFVVTFSGLPAMFAHELEVWQSPTLSQLHSVDSTQLDSVVADAKANGFDYADYFIVPELERGFVQLVHFEEGQEPDIRYYDASTQQPLEIGHSDMAHVLEHLHTDLHLPSPVGRYVVGLAGMAMLLSIIAGILIHVKWRKEFVMLRPKRSWRLLLTDHHKLLGLWTLPFAFILAFSGTILGLLGLVSPLLAVAKFDGDVDKAVAAVVGPQAEVSGTAASRLSLDALQQQALSIQPELDVHFIHVTADGDANGLVKFSGNHVEKLSNLQNVTLQLTNGELVHQSDAAERGPFQRIFAAVTPLHFVMFGDIMLKAFYALSTLALSLMIVTGNMIWLAKLDAPHKAARAKPHPLARFTLGICAGLVSACAALICASTWLQGMAQQAALEEGTFWLVWVLALALAFSPLTLRRQLSLHLNGASALLLLTLLGDGIINGRWLWHAPLLTVGVHIGLLAMAAMLAFAAALLARMQANSERQPQRHEGFSADSSPA
ncbi:peptidase [Bacterioplanes sanyensis]|uniref:PepSY-associated TM helix domain-containing protein n=1 Tax=Bacterioplanes sanyensis TaxID=1249553 RepID=UPI0016729D30|nr:PepSY-associated TM helix domain-containing protein [Bacterioplanes sanyensis]GGY47771.1 peptidase [Bacterioplanes sanyensis]